MPELPRKPGLPVEPEEERDPIAPPPEGAPFSDPGGGEAEPVTPPPVTPPPVTPPRATTMPPPPLSDVPGDDARAQPGDVTDGAADDGRGDAEGDATDDTAGAVPEPGETAPIDAMLAAKSAAEAAARQRAEADYQSVIDDAIRAAAWRADDASYVALVDEFVRLRGLRAAGSGAPSSASRAHGGFGGSWQRSGGDGAASGTRDGYGVAANGALGEADASRAGPRLRPAVYGSGDEPARAERAQFAVPLPLPPPPAGVPPRPGDPDYAGAWKELRKLWGQLPEFDDLPEVEKPFFMQLLSAILNLLYNKPPHDAKDKEGAKAPGKPGEAEGFRDPKGGEQWVRNPNPRPDVGSHGWLDDKGRVWVPTGQGGRAHGKPHWDVQFPKGKYVNVEPGEHINDAIKKKKLRKKGL